MADRKYLNNISRLHHSQLKYNNHPIKVSLPNIVDLRPKMSQAYDQGALGSCTANALVAAYEYISNGFFGSRLFLYYNERDIEGTTDTDTGAHLYDGVKALENIGLCSEADYLYDVTKFSQKPPDICYTLAKDHKLIYSHNIHPDLSSLKHSLEKGMPFVVGIRVYESFQSEEVIKTGLVQIPNSNEKCLGGHAVLCVGYDDTKQHWIMRNSYSVNWGDNGYFYLPYMYLLDSYLSSDMWVLNSN